MSSIIDDETLVTAPPEKMSRNDWILQIFLITVGLIIALPIIIADLH